MAAGWDGCVCVSGCCQRDDACRRRRRSLHAGPHRITTQRPGDTPTVNRHHTVKHQPIPIRSIRGLNDAVAPAPTRQRIRLLAAVTADGLNGYRSTSSVLIAVKALPVQKPVTNCSISGPASIAFCSRAQPYPTIVAMPANRSGSMSEIRARSMGNSFRLWARLRSTGRPRLVAIRRNFQSRRWPMLKLDAIPPAALGLLKRYVSKHI